MGDRDELGEGGDFGVLSVSGELVDMGQCREKGLDCDELG